MLTIDKYAYQNRWIAFSPSLKALFYVAILILALTGPVLIQAILFFCMVPLTLYVVKIHFKQYLKWLLLPFSFLLFSLLSILISISKDPSSFLASISIGSLYLGVSDVTITTATQVFPEYRLLSRNLLFRLDRSRGTINKSDEANFYSKSTD